ncbi:hypothetical protein KXV78_000752 [Aspergillus fumigatus]|nr:hypothetical protein KXV78_000752 [Aspergillus fumigatus]
MSASRHSSEVERKPDAFTLLEGKQTGLTPVQVAERRRPVPSHSTHLATPFPQVDERSFSSADERLDKLCEDGLRYNADGSECSIHSPSLQPDSIADTLNASDIPTTSDELGSLTTNTSPEILPIDPLLMQDFNSSTFGGHEPRTYEDRERDDSSYATCSPHPNTSPMSQVEGCGTISQRSRTKRKHDHITC